jgi:MFS family permease
MSSERKPGEKSAEAKPDSHEEKAVKSVDPAPPGQPADEETLRAGVRQAGWWAVTFGAGENAFGNFATSLAVPKQLFGVINAVPLLLGMFAQVVSANLIERYERRKLFMVTGVFLQALMFLPLIALALWGRPFGAAADAPWYVQACDPAFLVLLSSITLYSIFGQFSNPAWVSLTGDVVPAERRSHYFARMNRIVGLLMLLAMLAVMEAFHLGNQAAEGSEGADRLAFLRPIYAGAFAVALAARLVSFAYLRRMREPRYERKPDTPFTFVQFLGRGWKSNFLRFVLFVGVVNLGASLSGPFFLPYFRYALGYNEEHWQLLSVTAATSSIVTMLFWGRFSESFGNKRTLYYTAYIIAFIPFIWVFSDNLYVLLFAQVLGGASWSGFGLSTGNYILEAVTPPKRARCYAYFGVIIGVLVFSGSLIGSWLSDVMPDYYCVGGRTLPLNSNFHYLLVLSACIRLLGAVLFLPHIQELRKVEPFSLRQRWFFRIDQLRSAMGLRFGVIAPRDEGSPAETRGTAEHDDKGEESP